MLFGWGASVHDWNDSFGRLFLQTLAVVAEFEANLGHLHTRGGMALAKERNGKLKGKQPKLPEPARRSIRGRYATVRCRWRIRPWSTAAAAPPFTASSTVRRTGRVDRHPVHVRHPYKTQERLMMFSEQEDGPEYGGLPGVSRPRGIVGVRLRVQSHVRVDVQN